MTDENEQATDAPEAVIVEDDPVATYILNAVSEGKDVSPQDIAKQIAADRAKDTAPADIWRKYMTAVRQQSISLARKERLLIIRKGKVADPNDFKGLYKLRKI
ncbi:DUF3253 domain-containing protein [Sneathiella marina]|uniref:DUF3253 domain-containing protein n=1 Tax=Sneathiella marina TaxID=2950108 RepID=A0ABY4VXW3_9PROT|nr:DUF3253 domain-containing protein [Sneathiella marina]USG59655.1 DUF3253 domain-containing protein [Sneathiella marina]